MCSTSHLATLLNFNAALINSGRVTKAWHIIRKNTLKSVLSFADSDLLMLSKSVLSKSVTTRRYVSLYEFTVNQAMPQHNATILIQATLRHDWQVHIGPSAKFPEFDNRDHDVTSSAIWGKPAHDKLAPNIKILLATSLFNSIVKEVAKLIKLFSKHPVPLNLAL